MTLLQGVSVLYRCGCTLSSDTPFRPTLPNGNECMDAARERIAYKPHRDKKVPLGKQPSLAAMKADVDLTPEPLLDIDGKPIARDPAITVFKALPATCAVHGEGAFSSSEGVLRTQTGGPSGWP